MLWGKYEVESQCPNEYTEDIVYVRDANGHAKELQYEVIEEVSENACDN